MSQQNSGQALSELGASIKSALGDDILSVDLKRGELAVTARRGAIIKVLTHLRDATDCAFEKNKKKK